MKYLKLSELKPGMITGREVQDAAGNALLKVDTELTEVAIAAISTRNVAGVWVKIEEIILSKEQLQDERRKLAENMAAMFRDRLDDEVMPLIMRAAFKIRAAKLAPSKK